MKKILFISLFFISQASSYEITGKVIHIVDGDTVTIMAIDYSKHKIRLAGIDATMVASGGAWVYRNYYKGSEY